VLQEQFVAGATNRSPLLLEQVSPCAILNDARRLIIAQPFLKWCAAYLIALCCFVVQDPIDTTMRYDLHGPFAGAPFEHNET
jgi:hypothetical protein